MSKSIKKSCRYRGYAPDQKPEIQFQISGGYNNAVQKSGYIEFEYEE